jgi:hypothetical protein
MVTLFDDPTFVDARSVFISVWEQKPCHMTMRMGSQCRGNCDMDIGAPDRGQEQGPARRMNTGSPLPRHTLKSETSGIW